MIPPRIKPLYDYYKYVMEHGTSAEKEEAKLDLQYMRSVRALFPESGWEPMSHIKLIDHLVQRADRIAAKRQSAAQRFRYRDHQGKIGRTIVEERETVRAQVAAQIMLGLPVGKPNTAQEARRVGNIGRGNSVFFPSKNPFNPHLIIKPTVPNTMKCWLIMLEGQNEFRLRGWIRAEEAKQDMYFTVREREGGKSEAYWVPADSLLTVEDWWAKS